MLCTRTAQSALLISLALLLPLSGCGGSGGSQAPVTTAPVQQVPPAPPAPTPTPELPKVIPDNRTVQNYQILMFGNSHSASHNLPGMLALLIQTGRPAATVNTLRANGGGYLDERLNDGISLAALSSQNWSHIVLQAQKYSTSGQNNYSTEAAQFWISQSKARHTTPVLFPEHPREGNLEEGMRVFRLHQTIAEAEPACVAPIGPAWDSANAALLPLSLYSPDGNHASINGALLTAFVLYEVITGQPADALPYIAAISVNAAQQQQLRQLASASVQQFPACKF